MIINDYNYDLQVLRTGLKKLPNEKRERPTIQTTQPLAPNVFNIGMVVLVCVTLNILFYTGLLY